MWPTSSTVCGRKPRLIASQLKPSRQKFGREMGENIANGEVPFQKAYLRSIIDWIRVDDHVVQVIGDIATMIVRRILELGDLELGDLRHCATSNIGRSAAKCAAKDAIEIRQIAKPGVERDRADGAT